MVDLERKLEALTQALSAHSALAIAVSGGVDSMTLAGFVAKIHQASVEMIHAVSPAVPQAATHRVKAMADAQGWQLILIDAGEFSDPRYRANPANRCFFCKSNLYGAMAAATSAQLISGTNLDDLTDWRPGLQAAQDYGVRHPFVEAQIDKASVRAIARKMGFDHIAELPAAPCLSSRIETGITIEPKTLIAIDQAETKLRIALAPQTVRCRVRAAGVVVELDEESLACLSMAQAKTLQRDLTDLFEIDQITFALYQQGSAFLR